MARGISLHIALNQVNPSAYGGWDGQLVACEYDALDMEAIALSKGYQPTKLLGKKATREAVLEALFAASKTLAAGDIFWVTYSGHGGQVPDKNGDERDYRDETWCLYDGQLIDDELYTAWSSFHPDVRILVLSDSCHSGSVVKVAPGNALVAIPGAPPPHPASLMPREMPMAVVSRAYRAQQALYDQLQDANRKTEADVRASVLLISGCQDPQTSMDGPFNGAFTGALLRVWNEGTFKGNYRKFHRKIQWQLPPTQQPNLMTVGSGKSFVRQAPFSIH